MEYLINPFNNIPCSVKISKCDFKFKKGSTDDIYNYYEISLLPMLPKIFK